MSDGKSRVSIKDETGKIYNDIILIFQVSGGGKTLTAESIAEMYHDEGAIVISLLDIKDEFEHAYAMFPPQEKFHLDRLEFEGKIPSRKNVKIYHPFTFNIPRYHLPEIRFFTFPIKSLNRERISLLTEKHSGSDTVDLVLDAVNHLPQNANLYDFGRYIQNSIRSKKRRFFGKDIVFADKDSMFLETGKKGSKADISEIVSLFKPFVDDYFLTPSDFQLNIDVRKEIFEHPEKYHCLVTRWIKDTKRKYFTVLSFFDEILNNIEHCNHPIVFFD